MRHHFVFFLIFMLCYKIVAISRVDDVVLGSLNAEDVETDTLDVSCSANLGKFTANSANIDELEVEGEIISTETVNATDVTHTSNTRVSSSTKANEIMATSSAQAGSVHTEKVSVGDATIVDLTSHFLDTSTAKADSSASQKLKADNLLLNSELETVSTILSGGIFTTELEAENIEGETITLELEKRFSSQIDADYVFADELTTGSLSVENLTDAYNVDTGSINANTLNAENIFTGSISIDHLSTLSLDVDEDLFVDTGSLQVSGKLTGRDANITGNATAGSLQAPQADASAESASVSGLLEASTASIANDVTAKDFSTGNLDVYEDIYVSNKISVSTETGADYFSTGSLHTTELIAENASANFINVSGNLDTTSVHSQNLSVLGNTTAGTATAEFWSSPDIVSSGVTSNNVEAFHSTTADYIVISNQVKVGAIHTTGIYSNQVAVVRDELESNEVLLQTLNLINVTTSKVTTFSLQSSLLQAGRVSLSYVASENLLAGDVTANVSQVSDTVFTNRLDAREAVVSVSKILSIQSNTPSLSKRTACDQQHPTYFELTCSFLTNSATVGEWQDFHQMYVGPDNLPLLFVKGGTNQIYRIVHCSTPDCMYFDWVIPATLPTSYEPLYSMGPGWMRIKNAYIPEVSENSLVTTWVSKFELEERGLHAFFFGFCVHKFCYDVFNTVVFSQNILFDGNNQNFGRAEENLDFVFIDGIPIFLTSTDLKSGPQLCYCHDSFCELGVRRIECQFIPSLSPFNLQFPTLLQNPENPRQLLVIHYDDSRGVIWMRCNAPNTDNLKNPFLTSEFSCFFYDTFPKVNSPDFSVGWEDYGDNNEYSVNNTESPNVNGTNGSNYWNRPRGLGNGRQLEAKIINGKPVILFASEQVLSPVEMPNKRDDAKGSNRIRPLSGASDWQLIAIFCEDFDCRDYTWRELHNGIDTVLDPSGLGYGIEHIEIFESKTKTPIFMTTTATAAGSEAPFINYCLDSKCSKMSIFRTSSYYAGIYSAPHFGITGNKKNRLLVVGSAVRITGKNSSLSLLERQVEYFEYFDNYIENACTPEKVGTFQFFGSTAYVCTKLAYNWESKYYPTSKKYYWKSFAEKGTSGNLRDYGKKQQTKRDVPNEKRGIALTTELKSTKGKISSRIYGEELKQFVEETEADIHS